MEPFPFESMSHKLDTAVCDSDEEVYFGPVTSKELEKAALLKRKTQYHFPAFNWQPSGFPLAKVSGDRKEDNGNSSEHSTKQEKSSKAEKSERSISMDSLEGQHFTLPDKLEDSSKEEYCTALSGSSVDSRTQSCLNKAVYNISEDSIKETQSSEKMYFNKSGDSCEVLCTPLDSGASLYSNISEDSLESKPNQSPNVARCSSEIRKDLSGLSSEQSFDRLKVRARGTSLMSDDAFAATYDVLPDMEVNENSSVENGSCEIVEIVRPSKTSIDLPEEASVDKDGGFLSILSEAALYHASQMKSSDSAQSLEECFKTFGIDAGELEEQQLTNSIAYMTCVDSIARASEGESTSFYTGKSSPVDCVNNLLDGTNCMAKTKNVSPFSLKPSECDLAFNSMSETSGLSNEQVHDGTVESGGSVYQGASSHEEVCQGRSNLNETLILDHSSQEAMDGSEVSGVSEFSDTPENDSNNSVHILDDATSNNDSGSSSYVGEMNDTLEEYEMMMRYGMDYILGRKGCKKKEDNPVDNSSFSSDVSKSGKTCNIKSVSLHNPESGVPHSNSQVVSIEQISSCSSELQDAVHLSQKVKTPGKANSNGYYVHKVMSPLLKQSPKNMAPRPTTKDAPHVLTPKNLVSGPSKLPRVTAKTPHKALHAPSPQGSKHLSGPVTPSAMKSSYFKKPITPVVSTSRIPKTLASSQKSNHKVLENIQSPVSAYIHNSPSPVLVTNVKAQKSDKASFERELHARALWRAGEVKSFIPRPGTLQGPNTENINPNIGCGLPAVKYTRAPCVKLDEATKQPILRVGDKMTKLLDSPAPQVIKHEGRLRVNCGSPQLAAKMHSMSDTLDDSMVDVHSISGDISVCVSKQASRTDTLGH